MNRRDFLIRTAALSLGLALPLNLFPAPAVQAASRLFQVEQGRLLISSDGGQSWQPATNFLPGYRVVGLTQTGSQTYLTIEIPQGYRFNLVSTDGCAWRTTYL